MSRFVYKDITTTRSDTIESQLELISEARAKKVARISGDISSTDNPVQSLQWSKNLNIMADTMINGDASIVCVGDSINNPSKDKQMRHGYGASWEPLNWSGMDQALSAGNAGDNGAMISGANGVSIIGLSSGNGPRPLYTGIVGTVYSGLQLAPMAFLTMKNTMTSDYGTNTTADAYRAYRLNWIVYAESPPGTPITPFLDQWQGTAQATPLGESDETAIKLLIYAEQPINIMVSWSIGNGAPPFEEDYSLNTGYNIVESSTWNNENATLNSHNTDIYMKGSAGDSIQLLGASVLDKSVIGMKMGYVGGGGWRTEHHRYNNEADAINLNMPDGPDEKVWYTDEALAAYLDYMGTNIVLIMSGQNDGYGDDFNDHILPVISRYRAVQDTLIAADADIPGRVVRDNLKFLIVSQYDTYYDTGDIDGEGSVVVNGADTKGEDISDYCNTIAGSAGNEDIAFFDLRLKIRDTIGDWTDCIAANLFLGNEVNSDDYVHLGDLGSETFAGYIWEGFEDSVADGGTTNPQFPAIVYGNSEYTKLMASFQRTK